jgi:hypothetical protein
MLLHAALKHYRMYERAVTHKSMRILPHVSIQNNRLD